MPCQPIHHRFTLLILGLGTVICFGASSNTRLRDTFSCKLALGSAGGQTTEEIVVNAYREIWDTLGLSKEANQAIEKMEDPFQLPESYKDLFPVLHDSLGTFQEILREKEVSESTFKTLLLKELKGRIQRVKNTTQNEIDKAVSGKSTKIIAWPEEKYPESFSPDGKWAVAIGFRYSHQDAITHIYIRNTATGEVTQTPIPRSQLLVSTFMKDGKTVAFGGTHGGVQLVPFENGKLDLEKMKIIQNPAFSTTPIEYLWWNENETLALCSQREKQIAYIISKKRDTSTRLEITYPKADDFFLFEHETPFHWQGVKGTDKLFFTFASTFTVKSKDKIALIETNLKDTRAVVNKTWFLPASLSAHGFMPSPDGKSILFKTKKPNELEFWDLKNSGKKKFGITVKSTGKINSDFKVTSHLFDPERKLLLLLVSENFKRSIQAFSLTDGSPKGIEATDFPGNHLEWSTDKSHILLKGLAGTTVYDAETLMDVLNTPP